MGGDLHRLAAAGLERLGELAVQRAAAQPRHVGVERLPAQRVAEGGAAVAALAQDAVALELGEAVLAREPAGEVEVEALAGDGGRLGRGARLVGERRGAHQHRVADRVGRGDVLVAAELEAARAGLEAAAHHERAGELLDEERQALRAVVDRDGERRRGPLGQEAREQLGGLAEVERRERELVQPAAAAQLVAQPAQRVVARQAVGAVGAQQHQRQLVERRREAREQLERRLVGPLQVVEHDERGLAELGERGADRLEDRRAVARRGLLAELGEQQREVRAERPQPREGAGPEAQVRAQGGDDRAVGGDGAGARRAAQHEHARGGAGLVGEARLADAGLAGEEQQRARAAARALDGLAQLGELGVAAEERGSHSGLARDRAPGRAARSRCRRPG